MENPATWSSLTKAINKDFDYKNTNYTEAVEKLIFDLKLEGYIPQDRETILFTSELVEVVTDHNQAMLEGYCGASLPSLLSRKINELLKHT